VISLSDKPHVSGTYVDSDELELESELELEDESIKNHVTWVVYA
jgi:hypothetical protein